MTLSVQTSCEHRVTFLPPSHVSSSRYMPFSVRLSVRPFVRPRVSVTPFKMAGTRVPVGPLPWRALSPSLHVVLIIVQVAFDGPPLYRHVFADLVLDSHF